MWLAHETFETEVLTEREVVREDVMLGMRLKRGVTEQMVTAAGLGPVFDSLVADGLVERVTRVLGEECFAATQRGWLLGNQVFGRIWTAE